MIYKVYKENIFLKITLISTMTVILLILGIFLFLTLNLNRVIEEIEKKVGITVFLKDSVTGDNLTELLKNIENLNGVEKISYISKADALSEFVKDAEMKKFIDALSENNPLPASIRIKAKKEIYEKGELAEIASALTYLEGVEDVKYKKEESERLLKLIYTVRTGLSITGVIFLLISFIVILNTTRLSILSRVEEIRQMKSIGATSFTIRFPFIFEGLIDGSLAGIFASFVIYIFNFFAVTSLKAIWGGISIYFPIELFAGLILLSIIISVISNLLSIQKFLPRSRPQVS